MNDIAAMRPERQASRPELVFRWLANANPLRVFDFASFFAKTGRLLFAMMLSRSRLRRQNMVFPQ
jgi:hypothetical protein